MAMTAKTKQFLRDAAIGVLAPLLAAAIAGGWTYYQATVEYGSRLTAVEVTQREQREGMAGIEKKLDRVAQDTAYIRGRIDAR